jgi:hypothetical protein
MAAKATQPPPGDLNLADGEEKKRDPTKDFVLVEKLGEGYSFPMMIIKSYQLLWLSMESRAYQNKNCYCH